MSKELICFLILTFKFKTFPKIFQCGKSVGWGDVATLYILCLLKMKITRGIRSSDSSLFFFLQMRTKAKRKEMTPLRPYSNVGAWAIKFIPLSSLQLLNFSPPSTVHCVFRYLVFIRGHEIHLILP